MGKPILTTGKRVRLNHMDLIVQEYVDEPNEPGIFYYRMPGNVTGTISSVVGKELLSVEGWAIDHSATA